MGGSTRLGSSRHSRFHDDWDPPWPEPEDRFCLKCLEMSVQHETVLQRKTLRELDLTFKLLYATVNKYTAQLNFELANYEKVLKTSKAIQMQNDELNINYSTALGDLSFLKEWPDLELLNDVTFVINSTQTTASSEVDAQIQLPAHRCILAAKSDVFRAMLTTSMTEGKTGKILITDVSFATMQALVHYCYTASIHFSDTVRPQDVIKQAHKYQIQRLQDVCETQLLSNLSEQNVFEALIISRFYETERLKASAINIVRNNFQELGSHLVDDIFGPGSSKHCISEPQIPLASVNCISLDK